MSLLCLLLAASTAVPLLPEQVERALIEELSGERAKDEVSVLSHYERIQASEGWHAAAEHVKRRLVDWGYSDVEFHAYPSNGEIRYHTWATPIGWTAESGSLFMTTPSRKKLADYQEIANSLVKHSGSADVEAELVDVGAGLTAAEYEGKDVEGKIVLASGYSADVRRQAIVERGAVGVVTYYPPEVRAEQHNLLRYTAFWPRWSERDAVGFGFNVSKQDALGLLRLLEKGERVVLKASVRSRFYQGQIETLTTTFPGSTHPEQEIVIAAHLDHPAPSANDNASGAAGLLEMARTLKLLVDSGRIEPPKRTIRFMWLSEYFGTVAYLAGHPDFGERALAAINCDMIGEDLEATDGVFNLTLAPHSTRSYLNDVMAGFMHRMASLDLRSLRGNPAPVNYRILPYSGGSDHAVFTDTSVDVPAVMLGHWPDPFHHTSQDTADKTDPTELRRAMFVALGSALAMSSYDDADALRLAEHVASAAQGRIGRDLDRGLQMIAAAEAPRSLHLAHREGVNTVERAYEREVAAIISCEELATEANLRTEIRRVAEQLEHHAPLSLAAIESAYSRQAATLGTQPQAHSLTPAEEAASRTVPVRTEVFRGPLQTDYLAETLGDPGLVDELPLRGNLAFEIANFMDGKRSLLEVRDAASAKLGPVELTKVEAYVDILKRAGLVELREAASAGPGYTPTAAGAPSTDIFLARLDLPAAEVPRASDWRNITDRAGYDNQPLFTADATALLFTSAREAAQSDTYRYDLSTQQTSRLTQTAESEYSPTPMPGQDAFSAIRETPEAQWLWHYEMDGQSRGILLPGVTPVGYHAWADENTVAFFLLGEGDEPATLQLADRRDQELKLVATDIGRSLHKVPGRAAISFLDKQTKPWTIRCFEWESGRTSEVVAALPESEDYTWAPDGSVFMGSGAKLYRWTGSGDWTLVTDLSEHGVQEISRLAISSDGRWMALVSSRQEP